MTVAATVHVVDQFQAEFRGVAQYYKLAFNRHQLGRLKYVHGAIAENEDAAKRFQHTMNAGNMFFDQVPEVFDFSGGKTVVDVGGGGGHLLSAILGATPDARGTLFDREHMLPEARVVVGTALSTASQRC